jgi:hypothetical protein
MKSNLYSLLFLVCLALSAISISCNNDLDLFGEIQEQPVVYGLLSSSDTAQYIRLERSFADPVTSAVMLAKDENQVYYQDISVELINQDSEERTSLLRIDAKDDGYVRKEGDFLTDPNYLFKVPSTDIDLTEGVIFKLEILRSDQVIASAFATVLAESRFLSPSSSGNSRIAFIPGDQTPVRWRKVPGASSYAISFDMIVQETDLTSGIKTPMELRWNATSLTSDNGSGNTTQDLELEGQSFFEFLQAQFDPEPNVTRQLLSIDIRVTSYGEEIGNYLDVINANAGITSAQEVPTYTNIENGLGLFSSTNETFLRDLNITPETVDSLYRGSTTRNLNFTP